MEIELHERAFDGLSLEGRAWLPEEEVRGVVGVVHGLGEHIGRYAPAAEFFNRQGWALAGYDLRGHGRSAGKRGHTPDYESLLAQLDLLYHSLREGHPGRPLFFWGHSMGGNLVLYWLLSRKPALHGAIVTGPWLQTARPVPAPLLALAHLMNLLFPPFAQSNGLDPADLSRDPAVGQAYRNDPLVHDRISVRTALEMMRAGRRLLNHRGDLPVPTLLMHGSADRMTSFEASRRFADQHGNLQWVPWEGAFHELHHETNREEVLQTMLRWMEQHATHPLTT